MTGRFSTYLDTLAARRLVPSDALAVLVTASTARGWDHDNSDTDLVVISGTPFRSDQVLSAAVPLEPDTLGVVAFESGGRRWELKYWSDAQVDQLLAKVSWKAFDALHLTGIRLTQVEELFLARMATSLPLSGSGWLERRCADLDDSAFRSFMTMTSLDQADSAVNAALGLLRAGDPDGAVLTCREAFGATVEALLSSVGEFNVGVKWRCRRFRAARQGLLSYDRYWAIETMRDYRPDEPERWVLAVAGLCKELSMDIEV